MVAKDTKEERRIQALTEDISPTAEAGSLKLWDIDSEVLAELYGHYFVIRTSPNSKIPLEVSKYYIREHDGAFCAVNQVVEKYGVQIDCPECRAIERSDRTDYVCPADAAANGECNVCPYAERSIMVAQ